MTAVFADTFFFVALLSPSDDAHARADDIVRNLSSRLITTHWVLLEVADGLADHAARSAFGGLLDFLQGHPMVTILPFDDLRFSKAVTLYRQRRDKDWSLTDCTSFVVMSEMGIVEALTGDHHFEQPGFTALLK